MMLMRGPLTDRRIEQYLYDEDYRQARREFWKRKTSRKRVGNFLEAGNGRLIYSPIYCKLFAMISLSRWLHAGRLPSEQQRHSNLLKQLKKIMATLNEVTSQLNQANEKLGSANAKIAATREIIVKIGTETDRLKEQINNLPPPGDAPADLVAALDAIKATVAATDAAVNEARDVAGLVDDKVEDV
jgi:septal ring factor EnvC (AmiA/AmiB activator)